MSKKKILSWALIACMIIGLVGCGDSKKPQDEDNNATTTSAPTAETTEPAATPVPTESPIKETEIFSCANKVELIKGQSVKLDINVYEDKYPDTVITLSSNDEGVVTVSDITITAVNDGSTTVVVTATSGETTSSAEVKVIVDSSLKEVKMSVESLKLNKGDVRNISVSFVPVTAFNANDVVWSSSDETVVKVERGNVTALKDGAAIVTAKCGEKEASCLVTVGNVDVTPTPTPVPTATPTAEATTEASATPTPSPTKAPAATATPVPTKPAAGGPTATPIVIDSGGTGGKILVDPSLGLNEIKLSKSSVTINKGQSITVDVTVKRYDKNDAETYPYWSSFDGKVVLANDGKLTAVGAGTTKVYISYWNGIAYCNVTVKAPLEGVKLSQTKLNIATGGSEKLVATLLPLDCTDNVSVSYKSSDESVAKVAADGTVSGLSAGTCTITATAGSKSTTASVTVTDAKVNSLTFAKSAVTINERNTSTKLSYSMDATGITKPNFSSSNEKILAVSDDGTLVPKAPGKATITASAGGKTAKCEVTVEKVYVIVIDPGHDDTNTGAGGQGFREEKLTLEVGKAMKKYLDDHYANIEVLMTRTGGECYDKSAIQCNRKRTQWAQDHGADVIVSMHFNAGGGSGPVALASSYYSIKESSTKLAKLLLEENNAIMNTSSKSIIYKLSQTGTKDPEGRDMDYYGFIKGGAMRNIPCALIEQAFIDSAKDKAYFDSAEDLAKMGAADARATAKFLGLKAK